MFQVDGKPILAEEVDVIAELRNQLLLNGIDRFQSIKQITDHIMVTCPFHKNGQERKPSCGILTRDIKKPDGTVVRAGHVHCFTCGYNGTITDVISELFGHYDNGAFGERWLIKNFDTIEYTSRPEIELDLSRKGHTNVSKIKYISEQELDSYRYTHPYMYKRKLTDDVIGMFDVGYDSDFELVKKDGSVSHLRCITFPVKDIDGNTLFIARRSVDTKFFHYPSDVQKPVYGLYELNHFFNPFPNEIIICESIFNCLTCFVYGKFAVALNGTGTPYQMKQLNSMPNRKFILGLDPDDAGNRGREKIKKSLKNKLVTEYIIPKGKDINDLSKEEFDNLVEVI